MDFSYSDKTEQLRARLGNFMQDHIIPRIAQWWRGEIHAGRYPVSFMEDLKSVAKSGGFGTCSCPDCAMMNPALD